MYRYIYIYWLGPRGPIQSSYLLRALGVGEINESPSGPPSTEDRSCHEVGKTVRATEQNGVRTFYVAAISASGGRHVS